MGQDLEAVAAYDKALEIEKEYLEAWFNKAVALHNLDKPNGALSAYNKSIELNPKYAEAYYNRAGLYVKLEELEKAKLDLEQAINLDGSYRQQALADELLSSLVS